MAVNRYKGSINVLSGNHTDFPLWLFLSVAIHLIPAIVIALIPRPLHRDFRPPVYQVELMTRPEAGKTEEVPKNEELIPREEPQVEPEVKVKVKDIKSKAIKNAKKALVIPKPSEDAARPDEAVEKIRKKVAAEEAVEGTVEKIREKVREKEAVSGNSVKIAARPPARIYHYEELDAELRVYFERISRIVRDAWALPEALRNKGFKAVLSIHIRRDGTVESLWVEEGSGNRFYDESTLRAINKVSPLPQLPKGWKDEAIDLGLRF